MFLGHSVSIDLKKSSVFMYSLKRVMFQSLIVMKSLFNLLMFVEHLRVTENTGHLFILLFIPQTMGQ